METIATSIWSSVGCLVVIIWTRMPGHMMTFTIGFARFLRSPPEDLVADAARTGIEQDPAADHDQRVLPADQAERDDRQGDQDHEELRTAARVCGRIRRTSAVVRGLPASSAWIVMCSAPWYWKTRAMSGVREIRAR